MKKLMVVLAGILMFAVATTAFADVKVTVGAKVWANKWDWKVEDNISDTSKTWDNGNSLMAGPTLNLRLGDHFFVGASYLVSTKDYESSDWYTTTDTMAFKRKDLDVTMGVMFSRYFGMFAGYKTIDADETYSDIGVPKTPNGTWSLKGPGFGLIASIPLGRSAAIYGNFAVMKMKDEYTSPSGATSPSTDYAGGSVELGLAAAFSDHFSSTLGYKLQSFKGDVSATQTDTHTFSGVTFGLNLTF